MDAVTARDTARWRRFGRRLRHWRRRAGLTQVQLGQRLGYHHTQISKLEAGSRCPPAGLPQRADTILSTGGELSRLWAATTARSSPPTLTGRAATADPLPGDTGAGPDPTAVPTADWPTRLPVNGLPCPLHGTAGCALPAPHEAVELLSGGRLVDRCLDTDVLHALTGLLAAYDREELERVSAGPAAPVERILHAITRRLAESPHAPTAPALTRLAAHYAQFAGWLRVARGQSALGMTWYDHGLRWADAGGDTTARVLLLSGMNRLARLEGDAQAAHRYARALRDTDPARTWIASVADLHEARGYALVGDLRRSERHIGRLRGRLARLDERDMTEAPWLCGWEGQVRADATQAATLRDIAARTGDPAIARRAVTVSRRSLASLPPRMRPTRLLLTLRLADAYACAGRPEVATATAAPVLAEAATVARTTIRRELRGLRTRLLSGWPTLPEVRDFDDTLRGGVGRRDAGHRGAAGATAM